MDCPQRYNPKRICNDGHGRGFIQKGHWVSLGSAHPQGLVTLLSQENSADPKPVVDLNSCCDAVHLTPEINIHQQQVRAMRAGRADGL